MIKLIIIILSFIMLKPAASQWVQQYSDTSLVFQDVFFTDNNTGYTIATKNIFSDTTKIFKTTNGGNNWLSIPSLTFNAKSIHFTSNNTGYAVGILGLIVKTTNGGLNWFSQSNPLGTAHLTAIEFIGTDTGYIVGEEGVFLKTNNTGINWFILSNNIFESYSCLDFINATTGYYAGEDDTDGLIYKTTDGGLNWVYRYRMPPSYTSISFSNINTGFAVSNDGVVYKTTTGGQVFLDWDLASPIASSNDVKTFNKDTVVVACNGGMYGTTNAGINWILQYSTTPGHSFSALHFINKDTGYAVSNKGTIIKTTNGGEPIGIQQISNGVPISYSLNQNYPNPFNPITNIKFDIVKSGLVNVNIYDALGRNVHQLVNQEMNAGSYKVDWDASAFPSGVYFYTIIVGNYKETKKMMLVK